MKKHKLLTLFLILIGIVVGTFVANACSGINGLSWLSFGVFFGMSAPIVLDLGVIQLTFGLSLNLTLSVVICVILSLIIGRTVTK